MTTTLLKTYLPRYIPHTLDPAHLEEYALLIQEASAFERSLHAMDWTRDRGLEEWCLRGAENWVLQRRVDLMDQVRGIFGRGVRPFVNVRASPGAIEFEDLPVRTESGSSESWTWDENWSQPSTSSSVIPPVAPPSPPLQRRQRPHSNAERVYACTALSQPLLNLLGTILQEYTSLPHYPLLAPSQPSYPSLLRAVATVFRAGAPVLLKTQYDEELCLRLVNDCFFLAGEVGLMAVGMERLGYGDIVGCFREVSCKFDLCGVLWRERYLVSNTPMPLNSPFSPYVLTWLAVRGANGGVGGGEIGVGGTDSGGRGVCLSF
jgi:hypothetical protein